MRLEVPFTARGCPVVATYLPAPTTPLGAWGQTWTWQAHNAAEAVNAFSVLSRQIRAEGDELFGHGGFIHVRFDEGD